MYLTKWPCWRPRRKIKLCLISGKIPFCNFTATLPNTFSQRTGFWFAFWITGVGFILLFTQRQAHSIYLLSVQICGISLTQKTPAGNRAREKRHKRKVALFTFPGVFYWLEFYTLWKAAGLFYPKRYLVTIILSLDNGREEAHISYSENSWDISSNREVAYDPRLLIFEPEGTTPVREGDIISGHILT